MRFLNRTLFTTLVSCSLGVWSWLSPLSILARSQAPSPQSDPGSTQYERVQINSFSFRVRSDFEFELVADNSIVRWPIVATWDADGNLLIAESAGVKQSVQDQLVSKPHRVIRLIDQDRDGKYDTQSIVADNFAFPEGLMVYGKHLLVSAPPEIWKLTDEDGDGVYEQRDIWHDGKTLTYCANDLHGPFLGPEGWVYWSKSAFAKQSFPLRQSHVQDSSASHLYRKPFGSKIADRVLTGGMDNLVHVAFDQNGDRFFVSTFLHHPGNGLRDGIAHGVYGSVFGKNHAVLDGHPKTGPLMLPIVELGPAAPAGLIVQSSLQDPHLDATSRLIAAQFNLQRVSEHSLTRKGTTYVSSNSDLVIGDQLDFHPVGILEDIDGSLLVIDTGGWYDLCCPSSGTEERVATGGIYRLRKKQKANDLNKNENSFASQWRAVEQLVESSPVKALTHSNLRVRAHAEMMLLSPGEKPDAKLIEELQRALFDHSISAEGRKGVFWALAKSLALSPLQLPHAGPEVTDGFGKAPDFVKTILQGSSPDLLHAALQLTSTYAWPDQCDSLIPLLKHDDDVVKRLAAECLGRIGDPKAVPAIVDTWATVYDTSREDRVLEHTLLYALIELATNSRSRQATLDALVIEAANGPDRPPQALAAIHVLKETNSLPLSMAASLIRAANSNHEELAAVAQTAILAQDALVANYVSHLKTLDSQQLSSLRSLSILKRAHRNGAVVDWVKETILAHADLSDWGESVLLDQLEAYRNQELPLAWQAGLARILEGQNEGADRLMQGIGATQVPKEATELITAISNRVASEDFTVSAAAIGAIPKGFFNISEKQQTQIIKVLIQADHENRGVAWQCLKRIDLDAMPWSLLLGELSQFGPIELPSVVEALATSHVVADHKQAIRLIEVLDQLPATRTLSQEQIEKWFQSRSVETQELVRSKVAGWFAPPADMNAKIDELLATLETGDAYRGQDVFRNDKAACIACHRIGYVGGTIGPELTRIGQSRTRRDFVEAIAFPSHRIAQGYQTTSVLTEDDEVYSGLVASEDSTRIELILSATKRISLDKKSIIKRTQGTTSIMPAGIETVLTTRELSDLIAFLEQAK
jgi:putative heme-binding domain-containing protein